MVGKAPLLTERQIEMTLRMCDGTTHERRNRAIVLLSHTLGLRAKELAALRVGDVLDLATGEQPECIRLLKHMTKGEKFREVYLVNKRARKAVADYIDERQATHEVLTPASPLFRSQKGGAFSANSMQHLVAAIYENAGIDASSHSGRRTFATRLSEAGADLRAIQLLMGHASITQTAAYIESSPHRLRKVASMIR